MKITMEKFLPVHQSIYYYTRNVPIPHWKVVVEIYKNINKKLRIATFFPQLYSPLMAGYLLLPAPPGLSAHPSPDEPGA
jgi:hypothetical protein